MAGPDLNANKGGNPMPRHDSHPTTPNWFAAAILDFIGRCADEGLSAPLLVLVLDADGGATLVEYRPNASGGLVPEPLWDRGPDYVTGPVSVVAVDRHGKFAKAIFNEQRPN